MWAGSNDPEAFEAEAAKFPPQAADAIRKFAALAEAVKDAVRQSEAADDPRAKVRLLEAAKVALSDLVACTSGFRGIRLDGLKDARAAIRRLEKTYARRGYYRAALTGGDQ